MRAIIYARVSTENAHQETSLERQVAELTAFAEASGWQVVRIVEEQESGFHDEREGFISALDLLRRNRADCLLAVSYTHLPTPMPA